MYGKQNYDNNMTNNMHVKQNIGYYYLYKMPISYLINTCSATEKEHTLDGTGGPTSEILPRVEVVPKHTAQR